MQECIDTVLKHPSLIESPASHATRLGRHTGELGYEPSLSVLKQVFIEACENFVQQHSQALSEKFMAMQPKRPRVSMWSVVMRSGGHQIAHIHPSAWLSGVCYLQLPDSMNADQAQGWLQLNQPIDQKDAETLIQPQVGQLVVFPSYTFHQTLPFEATQERICIAFDWLLD